MNFCGVKKTTARAVKLDGIAIDWEWCDGSLQAVTLTDAKGQALKLAIQSYALAAMTLAPVEKKTVHVVKGTVRVIGTPVREEFDQQYEAEARARELAGSDVLESAATVEKEEVEIPF